MTTIADALRAVEAALTEREDEIARLHALVDDAYREGYADAARGVYGADTGFDAACEDDWRASTARTERDR